MGRSNNQRRKTAKKTGKLVAFKKTKSKYKKQASAQMQKRAENNIMKKGYVKNERGIIKKKKYT